MVEGILVPGRKARYSSAQEQSKYRKSIEPSLYNHRKGQTGHIVLQEIESIKNIKKFITIYHII